MIDIIKGTGIDGFTGGQTLTSDAMNILNNRINSLVNAVNALLRGTINLNAEEGGSGTIYTLAQAIEAVPENRRTLGIKLIFRDGDESWAEYVYQGTNLKESSWLDIKNWLVIRTDVIDGGVW